MPTEMRNAASTSRAARGKSRRTIRGEVLPMCWTPNRREEVGVGLTGRDECMAHCLQNAGAGVLERGCQGSPRGEAVAAAAEHLGDAGDVNPASGAKADLDTAARLLHEEQADLDPLH